jgi:hypothetical protein
MSDEKRPQPGEMYWSDDDEDVEIAEILEDNTDEGTFKIVDEDGDEAIIKWHTANERWEVDA